MCAFCCAVRVTPRPKAVGRKTALTTDYANLRDPANGAVVIRCVRCGMPDRPGKPVVPGLWAYIRFSVEMAVCLVCINELAVRIRSDPLTLDDVA